MGQRLVINNIIDGDTVNAIYYHWSAYTNAALDEIENLRDCIASFYEHTILDKQDQIKNFNQACLKASSGVSDYHDASYEYAKKNFDYNKQTANRNEGMIAFTEIDIDEFMDWSEGTVWIYWEFDHNKNIDIEKSTFNFHQLVSCYDENDFHECFDFLSDDEIQDLKDNPANIEVDHIPVNDAGYYIETLPEYWYDSRDNYFYATIR